MTNFKNKIAALIACVACLTTSLQAYNDCCFGEFTIGADWLYWTPCSSDQHYAIVTGTDSNIFATSLTKTKYNCHEWDSGVRVYGMMDNCWNGFGGAIIYTYINPKASSSVSTEVADGLTSSVAWPKTIDFGERLKTKWELEYNTVDAVLFYQLSVSCNPCLTVEAFSGLTWLGMEQNRKDKIFRDEGESFASLDIFKRHLDVDAIGPTFGLWSSYKLCDCLYAVGTMQTSLVVGSSRSTDKIFNSEDGEPLYKFKAKDECFCFPGLHLLAGLAYDVCVCDCEFGLRLGWEYVQWISAPTFPVYEVIADGIRSASSEKTFTMQGIFVGANASF